MTRWRQTREFSLREVLPWYRMKQREKQSSGVELSIFCRQLKLESADGKKYLTDVINTEKAFRIIQSVPSPNAEPLIQLLSHP